MIRMDLEKAGEVLGVRLDSQLTFTGVTTDSRAVKPGMLFAALPGERADGHDFVTQAEESGAVAVLVQRPVHSRVPQLRVGSVLSALGRLAAAWREELELRVVALTGSNGKTTTKELITSVLALEGEVLATAGNFNNELGVPLTMFGLAPHHDFAVLEMGAGKAGDIRYLAGLAKPDVGVITNVGPAHLKGMGSVEGVARTKGELYASLPAEGFAVFNIEEPWTALWRDLNTAQHTLTFGFREGADVRAEREGSGWRVETPAGAFDLELQLPGDHNVLNALAATAVAHAMGIGLDSIRAGLAATAPVPGRLNTITTRGGWKVIDDTYNANPASLYAALQVLTGEAGEAWLALGDMRELGEGSDKLHAEVGEAARALGVRRLYGTGPRCRATVEAFGEGARHFPTRRALIEAICRDLPARAGDGVTCLVKGSRSMGMEQVVEALTGPMDLEEAG